MRSETETLISPQVQGYLVYTIPTSKTLAGVYLFVIPDTSHGLITITRQLRCILGSDALGDTNISESGPTSHSAWLTPVTRPDNHSRQLPLDFPHRVG